MTSLPESIEQSNFSNSSEIKRNTKSKTRLMTLTLRTLFISLSCIACKLHLPVLADDSTAAPAFDMGSLANMASNLGNNPQIMSMVSSLLSQSNQKTSAAQAQDGESLNGDTSSLSVDGQQLLSGSSSQASEPPLRRSPRQPQPQQSQPQLSAQAQSSVQLQPQAQAQVASPTASTSSTAAVPADGTPSLSSLMSLLPSVMPNLNLASLSGLGSLLSSGGGKSSAATTTSATTTSRGAPGSKWDSDSSTATGAGFSSPVPPAQATATAPTLTPAPAAAPASGLNSLLGGSSNPNPAQQVINQVLSAYASGQIPNDLIQMGLSGRVPSALMELALGGQVPQQLIQMIITGQIPTATINAFLNAIQGNQASPVAPTATATAASTPQASAGTSRLSFGGTGSGLVGSTTRAIFEAIFRPRTTGTSSSGTSITVPTLLGPLPIQIPAFPNVRRFGQMIGGSISNMASMIPF